MNSAQTAIIFNKLMTEVLGFDQYLVQGGDWGGMILEWIVGMFPESLLGFHSNFFVQPQPDVDLRVIPYMAGLFSFFI